MAVNDKPARFDLIKNRVVEGVVSGLNTAFGSIEDEMGPELSEDFSEREEALNDRQSFLDKRQASLDSFQEELIEREKALTLEEEAMEAREAQLKEAQIEVGRVRGLFRDFDSHLHEFIKGVVPSAEIPATRVPLRRVPVVSEDELPPRGLQVLALLQNHFKGATNVVISNTDIQALSGGALPTGTISCEIHRMKNRGFIEVKNSGKNRQISLKAQLRRPEKHLESLSLEG